jgi:pyruvate dehydrogenase E2 component (dihydrolipoamide acetyltransferase)
MLELEVSSALETVRRAAERGEPVTFLALVVRALGRAIAEVPEAASMIRHGRIHPRETVDVFVHVDRGGRDLAGIKLEAVPELSAAEIASRIARRAASIREGDPSEPLLKSTSVTDRIPGWLLPLAIFLQDRLAHDFRVAVPWLGIQPDPFGVAMVTNVGSLGLDLAFPPIPPICRCSVVLALGRIEDRPWHVEGEVVIRPVVRIGVAIDHRLMDGAHAARLARRFRHHLEHPSDFPGS